VIFYKAKVKMSFELNKTYTRQEIFDLVGGGSVHDYLPNKDNKILCACLSQQYDPRAAQVILVGQGPGVEHQARLFCCQPYAVPVFFKKVANLWEYVGNFKAARWTDDPEEISGFEEASGRANLTKVIFLEEVK
jgi:hypothetical protein